MVALLVGIALGFLSGLGVGGGSLLLLWLTLVTGEPQATARVMNLMFFVPCALIATVFRWKQSKADWHLALPAIFAGLLGALLGNWLGPWHGAAEKSLRHSVSSVRHPGAFLSPQIKKCVLRYALFYFITCRASAGRT